MSDTDSPSAKASLRNSHPSWDLTEAELTEFRSARDKLAEACIADDLALSDRMAKRSADATDGIPPHLLSAATYLESLSGDHKLLLSLFAHHCDRMSSATTLEEIGNAFAPLVVARSVYDFGGEKVAIRAPSKIKRALASEAKRGWRSFESPHGANGRPPGKAKTDAGRFLEGVISILSQGKTPIQRSRLEAWLLAPGTEGAPGRRGKSLDGRLALLEELKAEMFAKGAAEAVVRAKVRELRSAIDNRRRNLRARKK